MKEITVKQYAKIAGISPPAVSYRMSKKKRLPGVISYRYDVPSKCYMLKYDGSKIKGLFRCVN